MKGSIKRYCFCKDLATGREVGVRCPQLADTKHGEWEYRDRHLTTAGYRPFRRRGFRTKTEAARFRTQVYDLLALARGDTDSLARLGDLVFDKTRRGGQLPAVEDVRRRLGLGRELDRSQTLGEWLEQWYAGKRALRESSARGYRAHLDNWLIPHLGHVPLDRLTPEHIADLFDTIESFNAEIRLAREEQRRANLPGDVRAKAKLTGIATQRRIFATLRNALNAALKSPRRIDFNPCDAVEMPAEHREPARVWSPEQVGAFLESADGDRLALLYRLVLLRGLRRGEACGLRWCDVDLDGRTLRVSEPLLQLGGKLVRSRAKTRAGERTVSLDAATVTALRAWRTTLKRERLRWGTAYVDGDLVFCREDGSAVPPDYVTRRFREIAKAAGVPVIRLHEGRHTAATLALEAGVDVKIVSDQLGHSTTTITRDLYQHVRRAVHDQAAEAVVQLLPARPGDERTGS
jgi:integrase